ncbi:ATP-binding cassette domain-containing protein [Streptococcus equinus]|uniref:ATP-binding cassette domain-containing protein n=1 Tax=Streptococcus equinus TaxID=1335 RepID=UPI000B1D971C
MLSYLWKLKKENLILITIIILWVAINVMSSLSLTWMLDALIKNNWNDFVFWSCIDILCWAGYSLLQIWKDSLKEKLCQEEVNLIRNDLLNSLIINTYSGNNHHTKSEYNSWLINDMTLLKDNGFKQFYDAMESIVTVALNAFAIIYFHWALLIISIILTAFVYFIPKLFESKIAQRTDEVSKASNQALSRTNDYLEGFETFFHNNQTKFFKNRILTDFSKLIKSKVKLTKDSSCANSLSMMSSIIAQVIIFIVTGYLVIKGEITTGVIFSIANLTSCLFNYTRGAAYNIVTYRATAKLIEKYPKPTSSNRNVSLPNFTQSITCHRLTLRFDNGKQITYPDFTISKGQKVALIGNSGAGKSTLIRILTGELTDYDGEICLDNHNYKEISLESLQNIYAIIPQKAHLFKDTLHTNLTLGRSVDKEQFKKALSLSHVENFIEGRLNQIYNDDLSGGQRARISIARELIDNKPIVIMDEGVSNLDKTTAINIERSLLQTKELTVIMITHHLYDENKALFDQIIAL